MINLYLVRHGHTIWSDTGGVAGRTDIDLSDKGRSFANALATSLAVAHKVDHWFCSPLRRTRETSEILRTSYEQSTGLKLPEVVFDERLVELDFGDWEGQTWEEVHKNTPDILASWGVDWVNQSPPNGETFKQQCLRCQSWMKDWSSTLSGESNTSVMVVSHGGSIRALICLSLGWDLRDAMTFNIDPASFCWLQRDNTNAPWRIKMINSQRA